MTNQQKIDFVTGLLDRGVRDFVDDELRAGRIPTISNFAKHVKKIAEESKHNEEDINTSAEDTSC